MLQKFGPEEVPYILNCMEEAVAEWRAADIDNQEVSYAEAISIAVQFYDRNKAAVRATRPCVFEVENVSLHLGPNNLVKVEPDGTWSLWTDDD